MPISHRRHGKTYRRNRRWLDTYRRLFLLELAQTATCEVFSMQMSCRITVSFRKDCDQIYWNTPSLWVYVAAVVHVRWEKRREIITLELFHLQNQNHRISIVSTEQMHKFCLIRWQRLDTAWHRLTVDYFFFSSFHKWFCRSQRRLKRAPHLLVVHRMPGFRFDFILGRHCVVCRSCFLNNAHTFLLFLYCQRCDWWQLSINYFFVCCWFFFSLLLLALKNCVLRGGLQAKGFGSCQIEKKDVLLTESRIRSNFWRSIHHCDYFVRSKILEWP